MNLSFRRWFFMIVGLLVGLFALIQLVPYGRDHTNPPVTGEPAWDSPRTEELVRTACYDCHSNETVWPGYASIAPASWLVYTDVQEARNAFNFNELTPEQEGGMLPLMIAQIEGNKMPPIQYLSIHTAARFSTQEKKDLIAGLQATFSR